MATPSPPGDVLRTALHTDGRTRRFHRGQALFTEGDRAERVFLIESGLVLVCCTTAGGRDVVLGVRGPGDIVGELSQFDGEPRSATVIAVDDVEAIVAPGSTLTRALLDIAAAHQLIRILAGRLRDADRNRLEFASLDTLGRIASRLLELGDRFGEPGPEGLALELPLTQDQLASWCGASREATVKALGKLRSLHTISTGRRSLVIRDLEALRRHARGHA